MPYRIDLYAIFILLGIMQALVLSFFFLSQENRKSQTNVFHGALLLVLAACIVEIFLMYTGYIQHCFFLVDFSEPLSFAIGPLYYLLVVSLINGKVDKKQYWHLLPMVLYFFMVLPFYVLPENEKYNAWISSYHPDLPFRDVVYDYDPRMFWVTDNHSEATLISLSFYALLTAVAIVRAFKQKQESFLRPSHPVLRSLRGHIFQFCVVTGILLIIKIFFFRDTGDHFLAMLIAVIIYMNSLDVIRHSRLFQTATLIDVTKYKTSALTAEMQTMLLQKLNKVLEEDKPYLQADFSLPELAKRLSTSVHILSQVINEGLGKSFFELTAQYRMEEAKRLLRENSNMKIEEVAERVGYNSKSSFNTVFKKITGQTPSQFRAQS